MPPAEKLGLPCASAQPRHQPRIHSVAIPFLSLRRCIFPAAWLTLSLALATVARAADAPAALEPLGIGLEGFPYPHPVRFLAFEIEREPVRMAFMDVPPQGQVNDGRTALLLHGKNFYGNAWAGTIRALSAAGWRVIVPDQIGFGKSSKPDITYSFDLLAANTVRLLDELGVKTPVAVVGHSTGGALAVRFARRYPERVSRLVLEDPIGLEDYRLSVPPQTLETLLAAELALTPEKLRTFYGNYYPKPRPELVEPSAELASRVLLSPEYPRWAKASALTYQMIYRDPVRYEYRLLRAPTLLIVGQEDHTAVMKNYAPPEVQRTLGHIAELARAAATEIPDGKVIVIPGVGHVPHAEAPEEFHRALLEFLSK